ncbi:MAG: hypothetical protein LCH78_19890 [Proteobacteria bacterium]|jgi:hypothetical protein|nr:hypothetical protein [Pseudomonadota bacterium]
MITLPARISPAWLTDGLHRIAIKRGPPSGLEFDDLELLADQDPVLELTAKVTGASDRARLRDATAGALHYAEVAPADIEASTRVLSSLLRLATVFASEEAALAVLHRLEAGAYDHAHQGLENALVAFVARQPRSRRARFEARLRALTGPFKWRSAWALPLVERDLGETPRLWLAILSARLADLEAETLPTFNAARELMRALDRRMERKLVLQGLALGDPSQDEGVLTLLFGSPEPDFQLARVQLVHRDEKGREKTAFGSTVNYDYKIKIGWSEAMTVSKDGLLRMREPPPETPMDLPFSDFDRLEDVPAWEDLLSRRATVIREIVDARDLKERLT